MFTKDVQMGDSPALGEPQAEGDPAGVLSFAGPQGVCRGGGGHSTRDTPSRARVHAHFHAFSKTRDWVHCHGVCPAWMAQARA